MDVNIDDKTNNPEFWWVFSGYSFVRDMMSDFWIVFWSFLQNYISIQDLSKFFSYFLLQLIHPRDQATLFQRKLFNIAEKTEKFCHKLSTLKLS